MALLCTGGGACVLSSKKKRGGEDTGSFCLTDCEDEDQTSYFSFQHQWH